MPLDFIDILNQFSQHYEASLSGYVGQSRGDLRPSQKGRVQRLKPQKQTLQPVSCRASRPDKVALTHDLVGTAVLQWFRQLRRIQSYCHSIKAGKLNNDTIIYRAELWTSIRRASGFQEVFQLDKNSRILLYFVYAIGPLPLQAPDTEQAKLIYNAFHHTFRAFKR